MRHLTEGEQLTVGGYQTHWFSVSDFAAEEFKKLLAKPDVYPVRQVEEAAKYVDLALHVLKKAQDTGTCTEHDYMQFDEYASLAEEILDELNVVEDHTYIRDVHEQDLLDRLEIAMSDDELLDLADDGEYDEIEAE